jgi:hypothetical protein
MVKCCVVSDTFLMRLTTKERISCLRIKSGLKKYCELDTMAMVIIYEAWVDWVQ